MPRMQPVQAVSKLFNRISSSGRTRAASEQDSSQPTTESTDKNEEVTDAVASDVDDGSGGSQDEKLQLGVQQMEAIASAWSVKVLVAAYIGYEISSFSPISEIR